MGGGEGGRGREVSGDHDGDDDDGDGDASLGDSGVPFGVHGRSLSRDFSDLRDSSTEQRNERSSEKEKDLQQPRPSQSPSPSPPVTAAATAAKCHEKLLQEYQVKVSCCAVLGSYLWIAVFPETAPVVSGEPITTYLLPDQSPELEAATSAIGIRIMPVDALIAPPAKLTKKQRALSGRSAPLPSVAGDVRLAALAAAAVCLGGRVVTCMLPVSERMLLCGTANGKLVYVAYLYSINIC